MIKYFLLHSSNYVAMFKELLTPYADYIMTTQ